MNLNLDNKNCLITGASRGIGAAIAEQFLCEGANICVVSRGSTELFETQTRLQRQYGKTKVSANTCDCTDPAALTDLERQIRDRWGRLDVVVSNVGNGHGTADPVPTDEDWEKSWAVNFESGLLTARTFLPQLRQSKGCLLFVASITGKEALGAPVDYSTAKTALIALSKNMSHKLGLEVRVNVIAPGNILFPGGSWDQKKKRHPEKIKELIQSNVPMKRFGSPQEIADAAVFLCSSRASFITGSVLVVDGGQTASVL